jgi:hypothetical protein
MIGGKSLFVPVLFKNFKENPISAGHLCNELHKFATENIKKEIMELISRTHKPSIIAEEYIKDLSSQYSAPCEFKFYLFNGKILFDFIAEKDAYFKDEYMKSYIFDGDTIEFVTQNFYKTNQLHIFF